MVLSKHNIYFPFPELDRNVIINPIWGKYIIVNNSIYTRLIHCDQDFIQTYNNGMQNKIIVPKNEDQFVSPNKNNPKHDFFLFLTYACNLRCTYCFQHENDNYSLDNSSMISKEKIDTVYQFIQELVCDEYAPNLYLFGGEPLLNNNTFELIQYADEKSNHVRTNNAIITNGVNLLKYRKGLMNMNNLKYVQVTIDGPAHIHDKRRIKHNGAGTFNEIIAGVHSLLDSDIKISIRINVDSQNIEYLSEFADYIISQGWSHHPNVTIFCGPYRDLQCYNYNFEMPEHEAIESIISLYKSNSNSRIIKMLAWPGLDYIQKLLDTNNYRSNKSRYCISGFGRWAFTPDGFVFPCGTSGGNPRCIVGKYDSEVRLNMDALSEWRERNVYALEKCKHCNLKPLCGGGCTLQAIIKNGDIKIPHCPNVYENIKTFLHYYLEESANENK